MAVKLKPIFKSRVSGESLAAMRYLVARKVNSEDARVIELILAEGRMIPVDTEALYRQREWLTHADNPGGA
jgi:hypothetical protein